jgi:hypothetical protein
MFKQRVPNRSTSLSRFLEQAKEALTEDYVVQNWMAVLQYTEKHISHDSQF